VVPSLQCQGSEAGSSVEAGGDVWGCKKQNSAGQEQSANRLDKLHYLYHSFLKISFVTLVLKHRRYRVSALLFPSTSTTYCLVACQMASH